MAMKIEVGKTYRTRDGREAEILRNNGSKHYPFVGRVGGAVWTWSKNGSCNRGGARVALDLIAECTDNPWTVCRETEFQSQLARPDLAEKIQLSDGWLAWRKREPARETHTGECWAYHYTCMEPSLSSALVGENSVKGTYTADHVDGKPVRILWEADT